MTLGVNVQKAAALPNRLLLLIAPPHCQLYRWEKVQNGDRSHASVLKSHTFNYKCSSVCFDLCPSSPHGLKCETNVEYKI